MANVPYPVTAEILASSQVVFLPQAEFIPALKDHKELSTWLGHQLSFEVNSAYELARLLALAPNTRSRMVGLLLLWAREHGQESADGTYLPFRLAQHNISRTIGASRETVSRLLSDFTRKRLISIKRDSILIRRLNKLRNLLCHDCS